MEREKIQEKLKKIKALAEQGVDGEKSGALDLYYKLLSKYEISEEELLKEELQVRYLRYDNELDKSLIAQIFYKVTGSPSYYIRKDKRTRLMGTECTEFELNQILFYYQFYSQLMKEELDKFRAAFFSVNDLFPDETARCYEQSKDLQNTKERSLQEMLKIDAMAAGMDKKTPYKQIEQKK